jgi:hypothetical protein
VSASSCRSRPSALTRPGQIDDGPTDISLRPGRRPTVAGIAEILSSEVVLDRRLDGDGAPEVISSWGVGPGYELPARPHAGGFVDRALGVERAVLRPLHGPATGID